MPIPLEHVKGGDPVVRRNFEAIATLVSSQRVRLTMIVNDGVGGALPKSGTYTPAGGHCWILFWGSGYTSTASSLQTINLTIDGGVAQRQVPKFMNETLTHEMLGFAIHDWRQPSIASHTLALSASAGLLTDTNDFHGLWVLEVPS